MKNFDTRLKPQTLTLIFFLCFFVHFPAGASIVKWVGGDASSPNSWSEGNNWDIGRVPASSDDVIIPASNNNPYLGITTTINTLNITGINTILTLDGTHSLTVSGDVVLSTSGSGIITAKSSIIIGGSLSGDGKLDLTGNGTAKIGGDLSVGTLVAGSSGKSIVVFNGTSQYITRSYQFNNLQIGTSSATTVNFQADQTVNLTLCGAGVLNCGNNTLNLMGDMSVKYFNADSGTVNLTGYLKAQSQVLNGYKFYNISIDNNKTYLSGNICISHNLNFISGDILLRSSNLTILPGADMKWNGSYVADYSSGYIVTGGSGHLTMSASIPGMVYPVGYSQLEFNPVAISSSNLNTVFDVRVFDSVTDKFGSNLTNNGVDDTWLIVPHSTVSSVIVTPQWTDGTQYDAAQELYPFNRSLAVVNERTNLNYPSQWAATGSAGASIGNDPWSLVSGSVNMLADSTYYFYVGGSGISSLPVTLLTFDAEAGNGIVNLNWVTASEINNNHFEVERSDDGKEWTNIGNIKGHGSTQTQNNYTTFDNLENIAGSETLYYRLKQVDNNGNFNYSMIRTVNVSVIPFSVEMYPNPANQFINIDWSSKELSNTQVHIMYTKGVLVYDNNITGQGAMHQTINMEDLPTGSYIIQVINGSVSTSKIIFKE